MGRDRFAELIQGREEYKEIATAYGPLKEKLDLIGIGFRGRSDVGWEEELLPLGCARDRAKRMYGELALGSEPLQIPFYGTLTARSTELRGWIGLCGPIREWHVDTGAPEGRLFSLTQSPSSSVEKILLARDAIFGGYVERKLHCGVRLYLPESVNPEFKERILDVVDPDSSRGYGKSADRMIG